MILSDGALFVDVLSNLLDRANNSIDVQLNKMQQILETTSNVLLDMENLLKKSKKVENSFKYDFNNSTIQILIQIIGKYSKIVETEQSQRDNNKISTIEQFEVSQYVIIKKVEFLKSSLRKLEAIVEKVKWLKDELNNYNQLEQSDSHDLVEDSD